MDSRCQRKDLWSYKSCWWICDNQCSWSHKIRCRHCCESGQRSIRKGTMVKNGPLGKTKMPVSIGRFGWEAWRRTGHFGKYWQWEAKTHRSCSRCELIPQNLQILRRLGRQNRRNNHQQWWPFLRIHHKVACRCCRSNHPMELSNANASLETSSGTCSRLYSCYENCITNSFVCIENRKPHLRSRISSRSCQYLVRSWISWSLSCETQGNW